VSSTVRDLFAGSGLMRCVVCPSQCTFTWFWVANQGGRSSGPNFRLRVMVIRHQKISDQ
jgi:hypothetical protein